ncbi:DUF4387 domain-containing protein [Pseudonocardia sp. HH130629-09]|uniref:DUF4387 domain-containing protein n=1 Tax=Pseudonocardia sp. HH130629-09 TaxID=1641402 RepID=UPI0006CB6258|nr:DUF4387 domain-containing protein [Pseudonocardia sp. HH130629-09]ALE82167.1 hypothetical protein XF36_02625 [Pseudonocardia sp. HH130629-09]
MVNAPPPQSTTTPSDAGATVGELASKIRSKNAGPFWVTIDVFLPDDDAYQRLADASWLTPEGISRVYEAPAEAVKIFRIPELRVVKISYPRSVPQGSVNDRDIHSAQQYIPLAAHHV